VALSGDTLAVGAIGEDSAATGVNGAQGDNSMGSTGAVYVFVRSGTTWSQQAYIKASNTGAFDEFGYSVALSGDTLAVGAIGEDSAATGVNGAQGDSAAFAGAVYVFVRSGATWSQQAYIKASNTDAIDEFGYSVALSGDTLAVGADQESSAATGVNGPQADNTASDSGAVYVFVRSGTTWSQQAYVKASNTGANDEFGFSVALSGDTLAVGAVQESSAATGVNGAQTNNSAATAGAVYVLQLRTPPGVDFNGDGNGDTFLLNGATGNWATQFTTLAGVNNGGHGTWSPGWSVTPARFDADAYSDLFLVHPASGQWFAMISDHDGGFTAGGFGVWGTAWQRFVVDLDGDGITDVFLWDPARGEWFQCRWNGSGFTYTQGFWSPGWEVYPARFNADTRQDFFLFNRTSGQWFWVVGGPGGTFTYPQNGFWSNDWTLYPGDYNGDGATDLLLLRPGTGFWFVATTGPGAFTYTSGFFTPGFTIYPVDLDADHRTDLFMHSAATGQWFEIMSNGAGAFTVGGSGWWSLGWQLYPTDFNADGRGDLLLYRPDGLWFQARNLTPGTFTYTSGFWSAGLTITAAPPYSGN